MTVRSRHGNARNFGAGPVVEVMPADELPPATPPDTVRKERDASGRFVRGNTVARGKRLRPRESGLVAIDRADPAYQTFARWGKRYGAHRRRELAAAHGGSISAGVGAIVESAAEAMAAARYLNHRASTELDPALFQAAARLSQVARQHELAAWELAAREAAARAQHEGDDMSWMDAPTDEEEPAR